MKEDTQSSLPFDEDEVNALFDAEEETSSRVDRNQHEAPSSIVMPSLDKTSMPQKRPQSVYHDLGQMYPDAPVASTSGTVVHRADLIDEGGVAQLMDWAADGDVAVVDLRRIIDSPELLAGMVARLTDFVVSDLEGELLQLTETRLLVLPQECRGKRGLADEAFV